MDKKKIIVVVSTILLTILAVALACLLGISPDVLLPYVMDTGIKDLLDEAVQDDTPSHNEVIQEASFSSSLNIAYI